MKKSDKEILSRIITYCVDVENTIERFGNDPDIFDSDVDYRNSISMSLLQIGELSGHLSDEFRTATRNKMDWPVVKAMRNLFAHNYGAMDIEKIWNTATDDIPALKSFCRTAIKDIAQSEKEANNPVHISTEQKQNIEP